MLGYRVDDRIARLKNRLNPLTPLRRTHPQIRPYKFDAGYQAWMDTHEQGDFLPAASDLTNPFADEVWFSIVVPMFNTPERYLAALVDSLLSQTFTDFEVIFADASTNHRARAAIERAATADRRLCYHPLDQNEGISANTNRGLQAARGTFVVFVDHDDTLAPQALNEVAAYLRAHPDTDIVYSDEDKITDDGVWRHSAHFKPDWSPHQFLCCNYTSHLSVVRRDLLTRTHGLDSRFDGAQDFELILRLHTLPGHRIVGHIPKVLYHWREAPGSTAVSLEGKSYAHEAGRAALETTMRALGADVTVSGRDEQTCTYAPRFAVAPGTRAVLIGCGVEQEALHSLWAATDTADFADVRVVELTDESDVDRLLTTCAADVVAVVRRPVVPRERDWLAVLAGLAQSEGVAAVAPRLVDTDGVVVDMGLMHDGAGRLRRLFAGVGEEQYTMFGPPTWGRDVAALTGDVVVTATAHRHDVTTEQRNVVWPPVTMVVGETTGTPSSSFNPNLIGLSNGTVALRLDRDQ